jgi:NADH dehydrogenase [ubiquinone] 1 alpha subcomplex assembly factor 1
MTYELFNFTSAAALADWAAVDDSVMGGVSRSRLRFDVAGNAVFEGTLSLEQGGGFASVRTRPLPLGVEGVTHYALDVLSDGKRYKLNLRTEDTFDGVNYQATFEAPAGVWTLVQLPPAAFTATFRGRSALDAPPLNTARVRQIGLMIADKQAGSFALALRSLRAET